MVQVLLKGREKQQENLYEELLRERAAVLARAGFAVEDALEKLEKLDRRIGEMMNRCQSLQTGSPVGAHPREQQSVFEEIDEIIDQFNATCQKAELQYYYLIVTREALGLRRHETVQKFYRIPSKKKKMRAL
ncbi:MAG: hypothetical protein PHW80_01380 [Smithellaceae bacterium]|jgi:hypothetical protein|nr:hypothetical protein [Smithellaceae bacterium]MDD3258497.1 hypothetical protein [Smithellaceae bacterium]MDD3847938.1 hypothetical protein [Smithellaceae bacterium]HOG12035.1 hypothetical protein [Smithellaceae bacterium]HOQ71435.1 hypothetical protein [Smithellaceae bacterium]